MEKAKNKLKEKIESQPKYVAMQKNIFSNNIFVFDLNDDIDSNKVVAICKKYQTDQYKETKTDSVYAWRSDYFRFDDDPIKEFSNLFDVVTSKISATEKNLYYYMVHHFWFAVYNKGDSSKEHNHGWVDFACVYYAKVPENSSPIVVPSLQGNINIVPKTGMLIVMPGICDHFVPISHHEGDRIIVAMNCIKSELKTRRST